MSTKQLLLSRVVGQFRKPTGVGGHLSGWVMSHRSSNLVRNRWAVDLLDLQPDDRVLELGCGPGVALAVIAGRVVDGVTVGVDHSSLMIRQARRRNAANVAAGRVRLVCATVEDLLSADSNVPAASLKLPSLAGPFHAVLAVNSIGFWDQPEQRLNVLRHWIHPRGRIALVSQPRCPGATAETTRAAGIELEDLLRRAGYGAIRSATLDLDPPVVCVQAVPHPS